MGESTLLGAEVRYVGEDGSEVVTTVRDVDLVRVGRALPVRRIRFRAGQRHYSGLFWSATTGGHVPYESRLELDRLWLADFDPTVSWIAAQPMWIVGRDGDAVRRHAPDLLLTRRDRPPLLVDVKPAAIAEKPVAREVFLWTSRVCAARGLAYEVWTGEDLVRLSNVRMLAAGRRLRGGDADALLEELSSAARTGMSVDEITAQVRRGQGAPQVRLAILAMLWQGGWRVCMDTPLTGESIVTVGGADQ